MRLKNILDSQSLKDFSSLFLANIFQKLLGLIRELIIAFFLGSSILYANFLLLSVVSDLFSQMTAGNALKANLLPKLTKFYDKFEDGSLKQVFSFSRKTSGYLFVMSQIIQTAIIFHLNLESNFLFFAASLVLSLSLCFNFSTTIFLTIIQARGKFLKYSYASITNSLVFTVLVYPLIGLASILGLALSRLAGILSMSYAFVKPMKNKNNGVEIELNRSDFNFPTLILGNFANIIIISSRCVAGADGSNSITFFMYAVVILNTLLTAVIGNVSTILLRKVSLIKNTRLMVYSLILSLLTGVLMILGIYFFSYEIIEVVYFRGAFSLTDVADTSAYLYELSFSFFLLFLATILFQPFLSLPILTTNSIRLKIVYVFFGVLFLSCAIIVSTDLPPKEKALVVMYCSSLSAFCLAVYSYVKYLKHEK
ncbi:MAG: hypothetical protein O3C01_07935 [Bacteroidetes bacterium]|nr:hypothetical protein [Bacteroidota bacterium]